MGMPTAEVAAMLLTAVDDRDVAAALTAYSDGASLAAYGRLPAIDVAGQVRLVRDASVDDAVSLVGTCTDPSVLVELLAADRRVTVHRAVYANPALPSEVADRAFTTALQSSDRQSLVALAGRVSPDVLLGSISRRQLDRSFMEEVGPEVVVAVEQFVAACPDDPVRHQLLLDVLRRLPGEITHEVASRVAYSHESDSGPAPLRPSLEVTVRLLYAIDSISFCDGFVAWAAARIDRALTTGRLADRLVDGLAGLAGDYASYRLRPVTDTVVLHAMTAPYTTLLDRLSAAGDLPARLRRALLRRRSWPVTATMAAVLSDGPPVDAKTSTQLGPRLTGDALALLDSHPAAERELAWLRYASGRRPQLRPVLLRQATSASELLTLAPSGQELHDAVGRGQIDGDRGLRTLLLQVFGGDWPDLAHAVMASYLRDHSWPYWYGADDVVPDQLHRYVEDGRTRLGRQLDDALARAVAGPVDDDLLLALLREAGPYLGYRHVLTSEQLLVPARIVAQLADEDASWIRQLAPHAAVWLDRHGDDPLPVWVALVVDRLPGRWWLSQFGDDHPVCVRAAVSVARRRLGDDPAAFATLATLLYSDELSLGDVLDLASVA